MRLDLATLSVVTVFVTALVGALLIFSWWQNRTVRALSWWGCGFVVAASGVCLMIGRSILPGWISIGLGNAVVFAAFGLCWAGFRIFERRPVPAIVVIGGSLVWLAACGIPAFYKSFELRVLLASLISGSYALASAWELWRGRSEALGSRYPLIGVFLLHAATILGRYPTLDLWGGTTEQTVFTAPWVTVHAFEAMVFTVASSFLLLGMTKERVEAEQRLIAARDPLTGTRNRRAFLSEGRDLLDGLRRAGEPCSLLLLDLDHFKRINDRHGHGAGDQVLRSFCAAAARILPSDALFARLGGEEFGCLLPSAGEAQAALAAEALRAGFASYRFEADGVAFGVTVSIGVATSDDVGHILDALLATADLSLYGAKNAGRNRVVSVAETALPAEFAPRSTVPLAA